MTDDEDLPTTTAHARYEWDCPECNEVNDAGDIEPVGREECEHCGSSIFII